MMVSDQWLWVAVLVSVCLLTAVWMWQLGLRRGFLAGLCRILWVMPIVLAFFPRSISEQMPRSLSLRPIHLLLDDSDSMRNLASDGLNWKSVEKLVSDLTEHCQRLGCQIKTTKLGDMYAETKQGFTPLNKALESWQLQVGNDPWMVLSDGGDWRPKSMWSTRLRGLGRSSEVAGPEKGLIVAFSSQESHNFWIESLVAPPFSFQHQSFEVTADIRRTAIQGEGSERVQVQLMEGDRLLMTSNVLFQDGETNATVALQAPALARGQHLLRVKVLPTAGETSIWDNEQFASIEVMPNTIGILHLLGAPSWDGRFLRRYLKAEPKYDLISFFILRDRWDSQFVSERDLSLIPFPVERLFNEELPNFKVVVIQNFALFEFLQPEFQENLVKFVKQGGGLLFVGGPRALQVDDLIGSPLEEILPFSMSDADRKNHQLGGNPPQMLQDAGPQVAGPYYDNDQSFQIEMANPRADQRALANVYDDWLELSDEFKHFSTGQGIHRTDLVTFKPEQHTTLLNAKVSGGASIPLAVASYPGKGRALWLFSDTLWRMAVHDDADVSRYAHHKFFASALRWLMRQEYRKPIFASNFQINISDHQELNWQVDLRGPAAKFFSADSSWRVFVCGLRIAPNEIKVHRSAGEERMLSGVLKSQMKGGQRCELKVSGQHVAFGSVEVDAATLIPETFNDQEIGATLGRLSSLQRHTGARLVIESPTLRQDIESWMESQLSLEQQLLPARYQTSKDHYWAFKQWWTWLLLLMLPVEVFIRRWPVYRGHIQS